MVERPHSRYTREKTWAALYCQHVNAGYALVPWSATNNSIAVIRCKSPEEVQALMGELLARADECLTFFARRESVFQRSDGQWVAQFIVAETGRPKQLYADSEKEAYQKLDKVLQEHVPDFLKRARHAVVLARASEYYHYHLADRLEFRLVICGLHDSYLHIPVWETRTNKRFAPRETAVEITSSEFSHIRRTQFGHHILIGALVNKDKAALAFKETLPPRTQRRIAKEVQEIQDTRYRGRPLAFLSEEKRHEIGSKISAGLRRYHEQRRFHVAQ